MERANTILPTRTYSSIRLRRHKISKYKSKIKVKYHCPIIRKTLYKRNWKIFQIRKILK